MSKEEYVGNGAFAIPTMKLACIKVYDDDGVQSIINIPVGDMESEEELEHLAKKAGCKMQRIVNEPTRGCLNEGCDNERAWNGFCSDECFREYKENKRESKDAY